VKAAVGARSILAPYRPLILQPASIGWTPSTSITTTLSAGSKSIRPNYKGDFHAIHRGTKRQAKHSGGRRRVEPRVRGEAVRSVPARTT
jgi:hypothetical protein